MLAIERVNDKAVSFRVFRKYVITVRKDKRKDLKQKRPTAEQAVSQPSLTGPPNPVPDVVNVVINRGDKGIGLSIVSIEASDSQEIGIYVKKIVEGSAAEKNGQIQCGDQILAVNGQSLKGMTQESAAQVLGRSGPVVNLTVAKQGAVFNGVASFLMPLPQQYIDMNGYGSHGPPQPHRFRSEETLTQMPHGQGPPAFVNGRPASGNPLLFARTPSPQPQFQNPVLHKSNPAIISEAQAQRAYEAQQQYPPGNRSMSALPVNVMTHEDIGHPASLQGYRNGSVNGSVRAPPPPYAGRVTPSAELTQPNAHNRSLSTSNLKDDRHHPQHPSNRRFPPGVVGPQVLPTMGNGGPPPVMPKRSPGTLPRTTGTGTSPGYYHPDTIQRQQQHHSVGELDHRIHAEPQYHNLGNYRMSEGQTPTGEHVPRASGPSPSPLQSVAHHHQQYTSPRQVTGPYQAQSLSSGRSMTSTPTASIHSEPPFPGSPQQQPMRSNYTPVWMGPGPGARQSPVVVAASPHARPGSASGPSPLPTSSVGQRHPPYSPIWVGAGQHQRTPEVDHRATPTLGSVRQSPLPHQGPAVLAHPHQRYAVPPSGQEHRPYSPRTEEPPQGQYDAGRIVRAQQGSLGQQNGPVVVASSLQTTHHVHFGASRGRPTSLGTSMQGTTLSPMYSSSPTPMVNGGLGEDPLGNYQNIANYPVGSEQKERPLSTPVATSTPYGMGTVAPAHQLNPQATSVSSHFQFPPLQRSPMANGYRPVQGPTTPSDGRPRDVGGHREHSPGYALLAKTSYPVPYVPPTSSANEYDPEEHERIKQSIMDEVYQTLEEEMEILESKPDRSQKEEERLRALRMEVEFRRRLRISDDDAEDDAEATGHGQPPQQYHPAYPARYAAQPTSQVVAPRATMEDELLPETLIGGDDDVISPDKQLAFQAQAAMEGPYHHEHEPSDISEAAASSLSTATPSHTSPAPPPVPSEKPSLSAYHRPDANGSVGGAVSPDFTAAGVKYTFNDTPKIIGAQEVYRDPRENRLRQKQQQQEPLLPDGAGLSFKDKLKLFGAENSTPKPKSKASSAQRNIELHYDVK